jgi:hypothetical protein
MEKLLQTFILTSNTKLVLTAVLRKGWCSASYGSFVVGSSVALRLIFCANNPPLRKAAKRVCFESME